MYGELSIEENGERMDVQFEEMSSVKRWYWIVKMPIEPHEVEEMQESGSIPPEFIEYSFDLIDELTLLPRDAIESLSMRNYGKLMTASMQVLAEQEIDVPESTDIDEYKFSGEKKFDV